MDYLLGARRDIASRLLRPGLSTERYVRENLRRKGNPASRASDIADTLIGRVYNGPHVASGKKAAERLGQKHKTPAAEFNDRGFSIPMRAERVRGLAGCPIFAALFAAKIG